MIQLFPFKAVRILNVQRKGVKKSLNKIYHFLQPVRNIIKNKYLNC